MSKLAEKTHVDTPPQPHRRRRLFRAPNDTPAGALTYVALIITIALAVFPLYWMLVIG